jgi:hypothetical protein
MSFDPERIPTADVEDILYLVQEMTRRHEESDDDNIGPETATIIMIARYPGQIGKVHAIMERMRLLPQMMKDPRMKGWSMDKLEDCVLTSEAVFRAVARCPVRYDRVADQTYFDADEFFVIVLDETPAEGHRVTSARPKACDDGW